MNTELILRVCVAMVSLAVVGGCVSIDSRTATESPRAGSNGNLRAAYWNIASYRSRGQLLGHVTLADALHIRAPQADTGYIWRMSTDVLLIRFTQADQLVAQRTYKLNDGFRVDSEGRIEIGSPAECGGQDGPGVGCGWGTATIFENSEGRLAVIQSGGGAGVVGVVPVAIYAKHLSLFLRRDDAPPIDKP